MHMAEQFLSRLSQIEASIASLGETLKRMITILTSVTEIKSELRVTKQEIVDAIAKQAQSRAPAASDDTNRVVRDGFQKLETSLTESIERLRADINESIQNLQSGAPAYAAESQAAPAATAPAASRVPTDKAMQIADILQGIIGSLKMGCLAGDVAQTLTDSKAAIMKIVPSDPAMVKIDRWVGMLASYPKRNELQAKDILKLKQEIKAEIAKYQPA